MKTSTLAAIRPAVTHWKRIERRGLSSDRGMNTTSYILWLMRRALSVLARHPKHIVGAAIVDVSAGNEQQVRQAVHVFQGRRTDGLVRQRGQFDHQALGAPANGTGHVQRRRAGG